MILLKLPLASIMVVFVMAAIFGLILFTLVMKDYKRPLYLALTHGLFAATGLGMLIWYYIKNPDLGKILIPIVFLVIAALGGFYMFYRDQILKSDIPKWMPFFHAGAAITGLILVIVFGASMIDFNDVMP